MPLAIKEWQVSIQRVEFNAVQGRVGLDGNVDSEGWRFTQEGPRDFVLALDVASGYYLLLLSNGGIPYAFPLIVDQRDSPADVAVIRPVFTQWSYHQSGFYFDETRPLADRLLGSLGQSSRAGRFAEKRLRSLAARLSVPGVNFPYRPFPAHRRIDLTSFYRRNNRWDKTIWHQELGALEGLWCDELLSAMPLHSILEKNHIPFHVYTDVDLHMQNKALEQYSVLIFAGQEGVTPSYFEFLQQMQTRSTPRFLVWGVQGFGYRQLEFDANTGALEYVCTRGTHGMWGDRLEERQPDWGDEASLLVSPFPEPRSRQWRSQKPYSRIAVVRPDHPIFGGSATGDHSYYVKALSGQTMPGLTWAGGEIQERVSPEAQVLAHLDDDADVIGIGEYRNAVIFAPTYLPGFFAYQAQEHPEVEQWFLGALSYLRRK